MSLKVSLEDITITSGTEVHKGIYVATIDTPGACLNTNPGEEVIMILKGRLL